MKCAWVIATLGLPVAAVAEEAPAGSAHAAEAHGEHHAHVHHAAAFLGAATTSHETAPAVGLDYLYALPVLDNRLGVGPIVEAAFASHTEVTIGLALGIRGPVGVQLALAPILVLVEGHREFGGRLNLSWGYPFGETFSVGPSVSADLLSHDTIYVYGLNVGAGF